MTKAYELLMGYAKQAKILSKAYGSSEQYYRQMYKIFTYPVVILSTVSTFLAGFDYNNYIVMTLSLATTIMVGFNTAIDPNKKEQLAHNVSVEFREIHSNVKQFIYSNNRTQDEIKNYSNVIYELLRTWQSLAPPIKAKFLKEAEIECTTRVRKSNTHNTPERIKRSIEPESVDLTMESKKR